MDLKTFKSSTKKNKPPKDISPCLEAMWYQANGNWDEAHRIAQSEKSPAGSWVHAFLHRVEGDIDNASYWYRLADRPVCTSSLNDEWEKIVVALT